MKLKEWVQSIGKRNRLKNGQGVAIGAGVYAKYYETTPQKKSITPPPPRPSNLGKNNKENMTPEEKVKELYDKFYAHTPVRKTQSKIEIDKGSAKLDTILAIETVINAIKHEDNRMYYEIEYWKNCLSVANAL